MYRKEFPITQNGSRPSVQDKSFPHHGTQTPSALSHIPILIVEPNLLLREGLTKLLAETRYQVIASAATLNVVPAHHLPELVLIGGNEIELIIRNLRECQTQYASARRVVFNDAQGEQLNAIFEAGAHACLGRDATIEALLLTLDLAIIGANVVYRPPTHLGGDSSSASFRPEPPDEGARMFAQGDTSPHLSSREVAIIECLVHGDSNKLIARKFEISEATVKVHVKAILRKIRASNRTQAAIWAMTHLPLQKRRATASECGS
jgi:two-component system nitrate/nitrite response regulator NarL